MCGRYRLARKKKILAGYSAVQNGTDWSPAIASLPGQDVALIGQDATRPIRSFSFSLISPLQENSSSARLIQAIRGRDDALLACQHSGSLGLHDDPARAAERRPEISREGNAPARMTAWNG
jgi:hypothetical protein